MESKEEQWVAWASGGRGASVRVRAGSYVLEFDAVNGRVLESSRPEVMPARMRERLNGVEAALSALARAGILPVGPELVDAVADAYATLAVMEPSHG